MHNTGYRHGLKRHGGKLFGKILHMHEVTNVNVRNEKLMSIHT